MRLTIGCRWLAVAAMLLAVPLLLRADEEQPVPKDRGLIVLKVPADAKVYFEGKLTKQTGSKRFFRTPVLKEDSDYNYDIKVVWGPIGKQQTRVQTVNVRAGVRQSVDFVALAKSVLDTKKKAEETKKKAEEKKKETTPPKTETKKEKAEPKKKAEETKKAPETKKEKAEPKKKAEETKKVPETKTETAEPKKKAEEPKKAVPEKKKAEEPKKKDEKTSDAKSRTFEFTYSATIKDLKPGTTAKVWIPIASSTPVQDVSIVSKDVPADAKMGTEKTYGNQMLYFEGKAGKDGTLPLKVVYKVTRKEVTTGDKGTLTLKPSSQEDVGRFLAADAKVPVGGKTLDLLGKKKVPPDQFAAAKMLYDVVDGHMKYSKKGEGWGRGDAEWACDSKFGNCTDFHSLFISMARGTKIPAKFEMGFPVPAAPGAGPIGGYHCWAWFLPKNHGWIPVDISEANQMPEKKEYYFGNLTENRVQFTTGRDITLVPAQSGPPLNFFIYPYVEVNGQPYPLDKIDRSFAYKDVK